MKGVTRFCYILWYFSGEKGLEEKDDDQQKLENFYQQGFQGLCRW